MGLKILTERIRYMPFERERDRPNLCHVRGDRLSVAIDAGHSAAHVAEFYDLLEAEGLPLPDLTLVTHWHWDHSLGMHATHGPCMANVRTDAHIRRMRDRVMREGEGWLLALDESVRREYAGGRPVVVTPADIVFDGEVSIDLGGCAVRAFRAESPHTDDSTLVHVPEERALILGDAKSGTFPTWEKDPVLCKRLAKAVEAVDADICLGGHGDPMAKGELVAELRGRATVG